MRKEKDPVKKQLWFFTRELHRANFNQFLWLVAKDFLTEYRELPKQSRDEFLEAFKNMRLHAE